MGDMNWRDKADLDLTSEDITAMAAEGERVEVRGPAVPAHGIFVRPVPTFAGATVVRPEVERPTGRRLVGAALTHANT